MEMDSIIGDLTLTQLRPLLVKSKETLGRHLSPKEPPLEDIEITHMKMYAVPPTPVFEGTSNNNKFIELCGYIKDMSDYTVERVRRYNEEAKDEMLSDVALMIIGNTNQIEGLHDGTKSIKDNLTKLLEVAIEDSASMEAVKGTLNQQNVDNEKNFSNLIPENGTASATNLEHHRKELKKDLLIIKDEIQAMLRNQPRGAKPKQPQGTGNARHTPQEMTSQGTNNGPPTGPQNAHPSTSWANRTSQPPATHTPTPTSTAKAGGFLGGRRKVNKGKYQNTPLEKIPSYYIRPGSTYDKRQINKMRKEIDIEDMNGVRHVVGSGFPPQFLLRIKIY